MAHITYKCGMVASIGIGGFVPRIDRYVDGTWTHYRWLYATEEYMDELGALEEYMDESGAIEGYVDELGAFAAGIRYLESGVVFNPIQWNLTTRLDKERGLTC